MSSSARIKAFAFSLFVIVCFIFGSYIREERALSQPATRQIRVHPSPKEEEHVPKKQVDIVVLKEPMKRIDPSTSAPSVMLTSSPSSQKVVTRSNLLLEKWISENFNRKVLLVQADNRLFNTSGAPITSSFPHASIVAHDYWSEMHNYSYVWITQSPQGAHGRQMAPYWNKVPAAMLGLRLARRANISAVVFLDSDSLPTEIYRPSYECFLDKMLAKHNSHFLLTNEREFWATLVGGTKAYKKALNSGVFMFDTSEESERFLRHWWLVATNLTTPYERQRSTLHVKMTIHSATPAANPVRRLSKGELDKKLAAMFGVGFNVNQPAYRNIEGNTLELQFKMEIYPRQPFPHKHFFQNMHESCCGAEKKCALLVDLQNNSSTIAKDQVNISCQVTPWDTFKTWPGDQDRLNWIVDEFFNRSKIVDDLSICQGRGFRYANVCFQHFCNTKGAYIGDSFWHYLSKHRNFTGSRDVWETQISNERLKKVWKVKTTGRAMEEDAELNDSVFSFQPDTENYGRR